MFGGYCPPKTVGGGLGGALRIGGLTFYKDYSNGGSLDADYSRGVGTATFTSTSGIPDFSGGGISMTSAGVEVLKYNILGNRTAEQETIVIKFTPLSDFANDGVQRSLLSSSGKDRYLLKSSASAEFRFRPNHPDSTTSSAAFTTTPLANTTYIIAAVCKHSNPYASVYMNGVLETGDTDDYITPNWGTIFYIGCSSIPDSQANAVFVSIAFFNRALLEGEILTLNNLM